MGVNKETVKLSNESVLVEHNRVKCFRKNIIGDAIIICTYAAGSHKGETVVIIVDFAEKDGFAIEAHIQGQLSERITAEDYNNKFTTLAVFPTPVPATKAEAKPESFEQAAKDNRAEQAEGKGIVEEAIEDIADLLKDIDTEAAAANVKEFVKNTQQYLEKFVGGVISFNPLDKMSEKQHKSSDKDKNIK